MKILCVASFVISAITAIFAWLCSLSMRVEKDSATVADIKFTKKWSLVIALAFLVLGIVFASTFWGSKKSEPNHYEPSSTKCAWCEKRDASFGSKYCSRCKDALKDIY